MCGLLSTWPLKAAVILIKNHRDHGTGWTLRRHPGGDWRLLFHSKSQVSSRPHPADGQVRGKSASQQEPKEWALLDVKLKRTLVCLGMGIPLGKSGGLAPFCAALHYATMEGSGPEPGATSAGAPEQMSSRSSLTHCHMALPL